MMEGSELATPDAAIGVGTLAVTGIGESLAEHAPLHGEVVIIVERGQLVDTPADGAVVENHAFLMTGPDGIGTVVDILLLTTTETDETDDDIIGIGTDGIITDGDARTRSCLALDSSVGTNLKVGLERNDTGYIEDDNLLLTATDGSTQRAVAGIIEISDMDNLTATTTGNVTAVTLGTGEGRSLSHCYTTDSCGNSGYNVLYFHECI